MRFMDGFSDELVKLATDVTGSDIRDKPEGETFKGKPTPLVITPKKDINLTPTPPTPQRPLVLAERATSPQPGPAKPKLVLWDKAGGRGVGVRVPIKLP